MRVDLPAPFSPTMPWIVPGRTASDTSRFAWTSPNHLSMRRSSIAGSPPGPAEAAGGVVARSAPLMRLPGHFAV